MWKKKTSLIRIYVDFRDLKKACWKDEFQLPNMDILIDSTYGQGLLFFIDEFNGYNKIKMSHRDAEKATSPYLNFCYIGTIYQWGMTVVFHDMITRKVEEY